MPDWMSNFIGNHANVLIGVVLGLYGIHIILGRARSAQPQSRPSAAPAGWRRVKWHGLAVAVILVPMVDYWWLFGPGFTAGSVAVGVALASLFLYWPLRSLRTLSEAPMPWYWSVLFFSATVVCAVGVVCDDVWLVVETFLCVSLCAVVLSIAAWLTERRRYVRVYLGDNWFWFY